MATQTEKDVKTVSKNILNIYKRKEVLAFALASSLAVRALNIFRTNQSGEKYWKNQTFDAFGRVFTDSFKDSKSIGFFIAHGVDYGVRLELANNRRNSALKGIASGLAISFVLQLRRLYGKG